MNLETTKQHTSDFNSTNQEFDKSKLPIMGSPDDELTPLSPNFGGSSSNAKPQSSNYVTVSAGYVKIPKNPQLNAIRYQNFKEPEGRFRFPSTIRNAYNV